jgi:hypothetical protein
MKRFVGMYLAWTESIYIWFPHVLERNGCAGGCRTAELATPGTAPDIAENVTIAAYILVLFVRLVGNGVNPACDEFPSGPALTGDVTIASAFPHGHFEVPRDDKAIAATGVENAFWGGATDELGGSVEGKG